MKNMTIFLFAVAVYLFFQPPMAMANICEQIQCSGHGVCVLRNDEPVCACNAGYVADASGVNCIAEDASAVPAPAPSAEPSASPAAPPLSTQPPPQASSSATSPPQPPVSTNVPAIGVTPPQSNQPSIARSHDPGWSKGAGILGMISSPVVLALSIVSGVKAEHASESYWDYDCDTYGDCDEGESDEAVSWGTGIPAFLIASAMPPVIASGGRSARKNTGATGVAALRITGWVLYGTMAVLAGSAIGTGAANGEVSPGLIIGAGVSGSLSIISFSIDALVSRKQVLTTVPHSRRRGVQIHPIVYSSKLATGNVSPMWGFAGHF